LGIDTGEKEIISEKKMNEYFWLWWMLYGTGHPCPSHRKKNYEKYYRLKKLGRLPPGYF